MKKLFLCFSVFLVVFLHAETKKRIFILHSYSQEYSWTKLQHQGFVQKLENLFPSGTEIKVEYLDTKRVALTPEYQQFFHRYIEQKYNNFIPDAIYVTDDNALTFFINNRLFPESPIFFSGINNLSLSKNLDSSHYKGVYETKDIVSNIELIRQFSPQTRDIWIVGDNTETYRSIESDIRKHIAHYPKHTFHFISSSKIDDVIVKLPKAPKSFLLLTTIGGWTDSKGDTLSLRESISKLKERSNLILCSMEDAYVMGGVVGGMVTSGKLQGERAAELMTHYFEGKPLYSLASVTQSPNVYMFDRKALMEARLILSEYIARQSVIVHEEKTFFESHQEDILNAFFLFFILFLIFLVVVFFMSMQKSKEIDKITENLKRCQSELESIKHGPSDDL